jgi:hypothetical protein
MPIDELDSLRNDAVGNGHRLLWIAGIILNDDLDGFAVDTAILVDGLGSKLGAMPELLADRGHRFRHRACHRNRDVFSPNDPDCGQGRKDGEGTQQ